MSISRGSLGSNQEETGLFKDFLSKITNPKRFKKSINSSCTQTNNSGISYFKKQRGLQRTN